MAQLWPAHRRALTVEDETMFAMGLVADMSALGFDTAIWQQMDKTPLCKPWRIRPILS